MHHVEIGGRETVGEERQKKGKRQKIGFVKSDLGPLENVCRRFPSFVIFIQIQQNLVEANPIFKNVLAADTMHHRRRIYIESKANSRRCFWGENGRPLDGFIYIYCTVYKHLTSFTHLKDFLMSYCGDYTYCFLRKIEDFLRKAFEISYILYIFRLSLVFGTPYTSPRTIAILYNVS